MARNGKSKQDAPVADAIAHEMGHAEGNTLPFANIPDMTFPKGSIKGGVMQLDFPFRDVTDGTGAAVSFNLKGLTLTTVATMFGRGLHNLLSDGIGAHRDSKDAAEAEERLAKKVSAMIAGLSVTRGHRRMDPILAHARIIVKGNAKALAAVRATMEAQGLSLTDPKARHLAIDAWIASPAGEKVRAMAARHIADAAADDDII